MHRSVTGIITVLCSGDTANHFTYKKAKFNLTFNSGGVIRTEIGHVAKFTTFHNFECVHWENMDIIMHKN